MGIGNGSATADHTMTMVFDSDEEMGHDGTQPSKRIYKVTDQKQLSEIVLDCFDKTNQIAQNDHFSRRVSNKVKAVVAEDEDGTSNIGDFNESNDVKIESQPFERAKDVC